MLLDECLILAKRLSQEQKEEIIRSFCEGQNIDVLSIKFKCTELTISRNLKKILGQEKFKKLIKKNKLKKIVEKKDKFLPLKENINFENNFAVTKIKSQEKNNDKTIDDEYFSISPFMEITPIDYEIDSSSRKEFSSVAISDVDFPKLVYMVVDKKIELEIKLLKDFPEWEFLPHDDLNRKTIEIFFDLNLAKRSCNKDQKVLKVPNTDVFRIAAPILLEKGISRIVCAENLIAL